MRSFRTWLLFRENLDPTVYNDLFRQELERLLPRLTRPSQRQSAENMRDFDWTNYIGASVRNAGFRDQDAVEEAIHDVAVRLLVSPGGLFRDYDERRHGPLDRRFKRAVGNALRNMVEKERNRRKYLPVGTTDVGIITRSQPQTGDGSGRAEEFRQLVRSRLGTLALAIFDARMDGRDTKSLVGAADVGSPSSYAVKQAVRRIKQLGREFLATGASTISRHMEGTVSMPEADRVIRVIAGAGSAGVARRDLIGYIRLPWRLLDDLLQQMVQIGILSVVDGGYGPVYRLAKSMFGVFDV